MGERRKEGEVRRRQTVNQILIHQKLLTTIQNYAQVE